MKNNCYSIGFISLGCPKALVDSEKILTQLRLEGYEITPNYADAKLIIINTCGFINSAIEESLDAIGEALDQNGKVIITGCLGKRQEIILKKYPNVLAITGPNEINNLLNAVHRHLPPPLPSSHTSISLPETGIKLTPKHYAYLKIAEGCNHNCSFCIIPELRGKLTSRSRQDILIEAEKLVESGTRELLIIAQDTAAYGTDQQLPLEYLKLADELSKLNIWIRFHYIYPYSHIDKLVERMADKKILPYLDIPLQHTDPKILKAMKRPAYSTAEKLLSRVENWRKICPDIAIRSTFIVGFPSETEENFKNLLSFLKAAKLDRVGCFIYSPVEGARANTFPNPISPEISQKRYHKLMQLQAKISKAKLKAKINSEISVLIDTCTETQAIGHTPFDAPEIDGKIILPQSSKNPLRPGDLVKTKIIKTDTYDYFGDIKKEPFSYSEMAG